MHFGYFWQKPCHQELSKIAESGHSGRCCFIALKQFRSISEEILHHADADEILKKYFLNFDLKDLGPLEMYAMADSETFSTAKTLKYH